jgi:hypothetical protein
MIRVEDVMNTLKRMVLVGAVAFFSAGIVQAADMDDLDVSIRVIASDDIGEVEHVLSLPEAVFDTDHTKEKQGPQASDMSAHENGSERNNEMEMEDHDEAREDRDDAIEDRGTVEEGHNAAHEEEHEEEHK